MENTKDTVVRFKLYFEDDTTANLDFNSIDETKLINSSIKNTVKTFNSDPSEYSSLMVSKSGSPWIAISAVTITTTERTYIF